MTWDQFSRARQLLAEESPVGAPARVKARAEQAAEDAQVETTKAAIRRFAPKVEADPQTADERARLRTIQPRPITNEIVGA